MRALHSLERRRLRVLLALAGCVLLLSACNPVSGDAYIGNVTLVMVDDGEVHAELPALAGSTVAGVVVVGLDVSGSLGEVRFHLNGATEPLAVVTEAPYSVALDTTDLADGMHEVSAWRGVHRDARQLLAHASFRVENSASNDHEEGGEPVDPQPSEPTPSEPDAGEPTPDDPGSVPLPLPSSDYVAVARELGAVVIHAGLGGHVWTDESGNGFDGMSVGSPGWFETGGPGDDLTGYYRFDGASQRIEVGDDAKLRVQEHALVWWERGGDTQENDYATVISKGDLSFHVRAGRASINPGQRISVLRSTVETNVVGDDVAPDRWRMFMQRWTGSAHELWTIDRDGEAVLIDRHGRVAQIDHFDTPLAYAAQKHDADGWRRYWSGDLAGVLLFDHSLPIEGMAALHATIVPVTTPPEEPPPSEPPPAEPPPAPTPGVGNEYFVAPWGSDAATGSWEHPFASLRPVAEMARPGDTVWFRGGVYDDLSQVYYSVSMSGEEGAPITLASYPGETAVLDGHRHAWHPRRYGDGRTINDPMLLQVFGDHLVFEDLTFRNSVGNGFYFVGYHNTVRHLVSHGHHGHGVQFQGSFNLLEYVTSYGNDSVANGGNSANGISLTDGRHIRLIRGEGAETRGNVIRYALVYRNSDDGIGVWNSWDTLIEYSVSFENGIGPTGNGEGFKLGGNHRENIGTVARFNIAFANRVNFNNNTSTGVTLVHNTSWAVRGEGVGFALTTHATGADANYAYNNLSFDDHWPRARGDGTDDRHNSWNLDIDDPHLRSLDLASPDFLTLASTSPAVNAGMDIDLPYTGTAPDLGALQLGDRITLTRAPDNSWRLTSWDAATP